MHTEAPILFPRPALNCLKRVRQAALEATVVALAQSQARLAGNERQISSLQDQQLTLQQESLRRSSDPAANLEWQRLAGPWQEHVRHELHQALQSRLLLERVHENNLHAVRQQQQALRALEKFLLRQQAAWRRTQQQRQQRDSDDGWLFHRLRQRGTA